jgi:hypothetical protein
MAMTTVNLAQQAAVQNQQLAGNAATASLSEQRSTTGATSQAAAGASSTASASPLAASLTAAAQQSKTGAATTTTTTTQTPAGTTTTQQTKPVEQFDAPLLKLPARANMMDVAVAAHVAAKESNDTTAALLNDFADRQFEQERSFLSSIIDIIWAKQ